MSTAKQHQETERFYKISYFIIPIPMIAGVFFAAYVLLTEDSRTTSYCTIAEQTAAYDRNPLMEKDFLSHEQNTLNLCKDFDETLDNGDGRLSGKVRWFVCKGTSCGPGWLTILAKK